jgi:hypothetical protein
LTLSPNGESRTGVFLPAADGIRLGRPAADRYTCGHHETRQKREHSLPDQGMARLFARHFCARSCDYQDQG